MGNIKKNAGAELEVKELLNAIKNANTDQPSMHNDELESVNTSDVIINVDMSNHELNNKNNNSESDKKSKIDKEINITNTPIHKQSEMKDEDTIAEKKEIISKGLSPTIDKANSHELIFCVNQSKKEAICCAGKHIDNINAFATIRFAHENIIEVTCYCQNCLIRFLELLQEFYSNDELETLNTTEDDMLKASITKSKDNCVFCKETNIEVYDLVIYKKTHRICKSCLNKLINRIAHYIIQNASSETKENIISYFEKNNIPFDNVHDFKPYILHNKNGADKNTDNKNYAFLLSSYQRAIAKRDSKIRNIIVTANKAIKKRDTKIENLHNTINRLNEIIKDKNIKISMLENELREIEVGQAKSVNSISPLKNAIKKSGEFVNSFVKSVKDIVDIIK